MNIKKLVLTVTCRLARQAVVTNCSCNCGYWNANRKLPMPKIANKSFNAQKVFKIINKSDTILSVP